MNTNLQVWRDRNTNMVSILEMSTSRFRTSMLTSWRGMVQIPFSNKETMMTMQTTTITCKQLCSTTSNLSLSFLSSSFVFLCFSICFSPYMCFFFSHFDNPYFSPNFLFVRNSRFFLFQFYSIIILYLNFQ